ncbi:MAG: 30S ribosomal protein S6 [Candidatus Marinimicrobia bacterium]|nr:30S ribosomal protein S6 [Candidatus Neomarinimicrobiota bacterium]
MRYYETLYIVHPDYEEDRLEKVRQEVDQRVEERLDVKIINSYVWGKRKLAYLVDKQKYGTYMMLQYSMESLKLASFNSWMELNESILAYMTIRLEEEPASRNGHDSSVPTREVESKKEKIKKEESTKA